MSSLARSARMPRRPSAGFSSCASLRKASGLSAPASSTRTTTFLPGKAASSCVYDSRCCSTVGAWFDAEEEELGAEQARRPRRRGRRPRRRPRACRGWRAAATGVPSARAPAVIGARRRRRAGGGAVLRAARARRRVGCVVTTPASRHPRSPSRPSTRPSPSTAPTIGDDRLLAGEDRGVRGRSALGGDQGEHLVEVEQRGVGRREILRDEDERMPGVGHAGSRRRRAAAR